MQEDSTTVQRDAERFPRFALLHLASSSGELTRRWLEELRRRLPEHPQRILPDETLLNHVPELLRQLFESVLSGRRSDTEFVDIELQRLGNLRRSQGYGLEEVLAEFEILRRIVLEELTHHADAFECPIPPGDALQVAADIEMAIGRLVEVTSRLFADRASSARLERAELLSAFGRSVTHELRNRLNVATLLLRLYREAACEPGSEPGASHLQGIENALARIERVVADVFSVAVSQRHHAQVEGGVQAFDELVDASLEDLAELAEERGVEISVRGSLPSFPVDGTRVQLVLMNLLTNAIKYSDRAKDPRWVEIAATRTARPREWQVDVRDNGVGIPAHLHAHVFEENLRAPETAAEDGEGIGLGLARQAVVQLDGRLWFSSTPGEGSLFSFTLREPSSELEV